MLRHISSTEFPVNPDEGLAISKGAVAGTTYIHKFGAAPDFNVSDGFVTVWDGVDDSEAWTQTVYQYSATADIDSVSSESAGDTVQVEVQGLDTNYNLVSQNATLNGQTRVALATPLIRIFRMKNIGATDLVGHVFCFVNGTLTGGIPNTSADIRAIIQPGNNQTLMAIYTVPAGVTAYLRSFHADTAAAKRASTHTVRLEMREFGGVFQLKNISNMSVDGNGTTGQDYEEPRKIVEKTDIQISIDTDQDIAGVAAGFNLVLVDN